MKRAKWWMGLCAAGCVCAAAGASAALPRASETAGGVEWTFSIAANGAIVTAASPATGALTVPATLGGQPVVEIGYAAFASCEELTAVTIPAGVESIADRAFQYCSLLERVTIPASVTNIGALAFQYCESLPALALPQGLDGIGNNACYHCTGMQKLYVPLAWWGTSKASAAGADCAVVYGEPGVETVLFDANGGSCATASRSYAVGQPYGWLPEATHTYYAFTGWWTATNGGTLLTATNLASLEGRRVLYAQWTPRNFQVVAFDPNGGLCDTTNRTYDFGSTYSPLPLPTREHYAFAGWWTSSYGGENITEESAVTTNAARTLYAHWTRSEQVVTFYANGGTCDTTNQVFEIGKTYKPLPQATREGYAFDGWFTGSGGGDRISAATTVTASETRTLYAHWTLVEQLVTFDANGGTCSTTNHAYAVGGTYAWLPDVVRDGCAFIGWQTPDGEEILETSVVPEQRFLKVQARWLQCSLVNEEAQVTRMIPTNAVGAIVIPAECQGYPITSIGSYAFADCRGLTSVTIGDSVTSIGDSAFGSCTNLTSVTIGNSVTDIGNEAFRYCSGLTSVVIPASVTSIGTQAFSYCGSLVTFSVDNENPAYQSMSGLLLTKDGTTLIRGMIGDVVIPGSVTSIGNSAFSGCSGLTSVTIPDSVTIIESFAFGDCNGLTSVTIPDGVTSIGAGAFGSCRGLTSVTIPDSVTNIGASAFSGCNGLTNVTIPDSVTSIGGGAFRNCRGLTSVTIPDSVTIIDSFAFEDCSGLTSVTIGDSVTSIGWIAFSGCSGLTSVTIPDSVVSIGYEAFYGCSGLKTLYAPESWKTKYVDGRFWSDYARVPSSCEIIYGAPPEAPKTSTGVPYAWLEERGLGDGTAEGYEAAAAADAANGAYKVWECYVAGLDPADPAARFTAEIGFTDGTPVVSWTPDLNEKGAKAARSYQVEGRPAMTNEWGPANAASRFFRVKVSLP